MCRTDGGSGEMMNFDGISAEGALTVPMVRSDFPIERLAQLSSSAFQIGFARQAMRMLSASHVVAYEATHEGLFMRAQNEETLAKPVDILRDLHGCCASACRHVILKASATTWSGARPC